MRHESQKTKLALLLEYVGMWRKRAGSRETIAQLIVQAHISRGGNKLPKLQFETSGDAFTVWKNAADRIFRWLDDETKDGNFMPVNFEDSILAAMPEDLRLAYLNDWLGRFNMGAKGLHDNGVEICPAQLLPGVIKESSEATFAMASLPANPTVADLEAADREFAEAIEALRKGRAAFRAKRAHLKVA